MRRANSDKCTRLAACQLLHPCLCTATAKYSETIGQVVLQGIIQRAASVSKTSVRADLFDQPNSYLLLQGAHCITGLNAS